MDYVLGFVFSDCLDSKVLLIEKTKPAWQKGKLNGIGGKIEPGETPLEAMVRETNEETGLSVVDYVHYCTMSFAQDTVLVFVGFADFDLLRDESPTEEKLHVVKIPDVLLKKTEIPTMSNLPWLIAMAHDRGFKTFLTVNYNEANG